MKNLHCPQICAYYLPTAPLARSEIELIITEGRFHQVKRMFEAVGMKVTFLRRIAMGELKIDESLPTGAYRSLSEEEVSLLRFDMPQ